MNLHAIKTALVCTECAMRMYVRRICRHCHCCTCNYLLSLLLCCMQYSGIIRGLNFAIIVNSYIILTYHQSQCVSPTENKMVFSDMSPTQQAVIWRWAHVGSHWIGIVICVWNIISKHVSLKYRDQYLLQVLFIVSWCSRKKFLTVTKLRAKSEEKYIAFFSRSKMNLL